MTSAYPSSPFLLLSHHPRLCCYNLLYIYRLAGRTALEAMGLHPCLLLTLISRADKSLTQRVRVEMPMLSVALQEINAACL